MFVDDEPTDGQAGFYKGRHAERETADIEFLSRK